MGILCPSSRTGCRDWNPSGSSTNPALGGDTKALEGILLILLIFLIDIPDIPDPGEQLLPVLVSPTLPVQLHEEHNTFPEERRNFGAGSGARLSLVLSLTHVGAR